MKAAKFAMKDELEELLGKLCVDHGFCLPLDYFEAISAKKRYTSEQFVEDVFLADGTGEKDKEIYFTIIRKEFEKLFGKEINVWNRRFLVKKKGRTRKLESNAPVLLEFARIERATNLKWEKVCKSYEFRGRRKLRIRIGRYQ